MHVTAVEISPNVIDFTVERVAQLRSGNYGPVYERLVSVKNAHDPLNLFRLNSNIRPTI